MLTPRLLLFGDQTVTKLDAVRKLASQAKRSPTLARYLRDAVDVVQTEIAGLPATERAVFGAWDDLLALAEHHAAEEWPHETSGTALMCIVRIGELILYASMDGWPSLSAHSEAGTRRPTQDS